MFSQKAQICILLWQPPWIFWDACHGGLNRRPRATFCCLLPYAVDLRADRDERRIKQAHRLRGCTVNSFQTHPGVCFYLPLMPPKNYWPEWCELFLAAPREVLDSPQLWIIGELFQVPFRHSGKQVQPGRLQRRRRRRKNPQPTGPPTHVETSAVTSCGNITGGGSYESDRSPRESKVPSRGPSELQWCRDSYAGCPHSLISYIP